MNKRYIRRLESVGRAFSLIINIDPFAFSLSEPDACVEASLSRSSCGSTLVLDSELLPACYI